MSAPGLMICLPCGVGEGEDDDARLLRADELLARAVILGSRPLEQLCSCAVHGGGGVVHLESPPCGEIHCLCPESVVRAHNIKGSPSREKICHCLSVACSNGCKAKATALTARDLLVAALKLTKGTYPPAYSALGRFLSMNQPNAIAAIGWPTAALDALTEVERSCLDCSIDWNNITGKQLCLAAIWLDRGREFAAPYDALSFMMHADPQQRVKLPSGEELCYDELWLRVDTIRRDQSASDAGGRSPRLGPSRAAAAAAAATGARGGPANALAKAPKAPTAYARNWTAIRDSLLVAVRGRCSWVEPALVDKILECYLYNTESAPGCTTFHWLLATAAGAPAPFMHSMGNWSQDLGSAARALQAGNAQAGLDAAQAVSEKSGLLPGVSDAAKLYCALAFLDMDTPQPRDFFSPAPYLGDAVLLLQSYRDDVLENKAPLDGVYLLAAALVELQQCGINTKARDDERVKIAELLLLAFQYFIPCPREPPCEEDVKTWRETHKWESAGWNRLWKEANSAVASYNKAKIEAARRGLKAQEQWAQLKEQIAASSGQGRPLVALNKLMQQVGLEEVKLAALDLLRSVLSAKSGIPEVNSFLNFVFKGNPGTGKTTVGEMFAQILAELGIRPDKEEDKQKTAEAKAEAEKKAKTEAEIQATKDKEAKDAEVDRLKADLKEKLQSADLIAAQKELKDVELVVATMEGAKQNVRSLQGQISGIAGLDAPATRFKELTLEHAGRTFDDFSTELARHKRRLSELVEKVDHLQKKKNELDRANVAAAERAAVAKSAADEAAAKAKASAAVVAKDQPVVERFVVLDGGLLSTPPSPSYVGGSRDLEMKINALMDPSLEAKGLRLGGVIFIDEAHNLDYSQRPEGLDTIRRIVKMSDEYKKYITFILCGYEKDIEEKVFRADPGLPRRFPYRVLFKDYNAIELAEILKLKVSELTPATPVGGAGAGGDARRTGGGSAGRGAKGNGAGSASAPPAPAGPRFSVAENVAQAFGRRLARGAGTRGFGNGGLVVNRLSEQAIIGRWRKRVIPDPTKSPPPTDKLMVLTMDDVLGPPPDPTTGPAAEILKELGQLPGLHKVKRSFQQLVEQMRRMYDADVCPDLAGGASLNAGLLNRVFYGNPGTFKTTVARLYGRLLSACGFLTYGDIVELKPADFLGDKVGQSEQQTRALVEQCAGKVMFIDEAYGIHQNTTYGPAVFNTLVGEIPDKGGADMAVIMAGYPDEMRDMLDNANPGLARRFPDPQCRYEFESFGRKECRMVVMSHSSKLGLGLDFGAADAAATQLARQAMRRNFGNAGDCCIFVEQLRDFMAREQPALQGRVRVAKADVERMLEEERNSDPLNALPLPPKLAAYVEAARRGVLLAAQKRLPPPDLQHILLMAEPGTGKSTCARKLARELYLAGVLPKRDPEIIESAEKLQAGFSGQTSGKVMDVLKRAQGGVLFIDEAPRLKPRAGGDFKDEILGTILGAIGSRDSPFAGKLLIVLAGYEKGMRELVSTADPGLARRFPVEVTLPPCDAETCVSAVERSLLAKAASLAGSPEAAPAALSENIRKSLKAFFDERIALVNFGNFGEVDTFVSALSSKSLDSLGNRARLGAQQGRGEAAEIERDLLNAWDGLPTQADVDAVCLEAITRARENSATASNARARDEAAKKEAAAGGGASFASSTASGAAASVDVDVDVGTAADSLAGDGGQAAQAVDPRRLDSQRKARLIAYELLLSYGGDALALLGGESPADMALLEQQYLSRAETQQLALELEELQALFEDYMSEQQSMLQSKQAEIDECFAQRRRATAAQRQTEAANGMALENDTRRLSMSARELVTITGYCGICGGLDAPGSGCGFNGRSPARREQRDVTRWSEQTYAQI